MLKNQKIKKMVSIGMITCTLFSASIPLASTVNATECNVIKQQDDDQVPKIVKNGVRLFIIDGKLYEIPEDMKNPTAKEIELIKQQRGKLTWAAKAIKIAYKKLPKKVKKLIASYIGINRLVSTIEHYTGGIEDAIYQICRKANMPKSAARLVAKTITLLI